MNKNEYRLTVDIKRKQTAIVPTFVQYDTATLVFTILDNKRPLDLSKFTKAEVASKRNDGITVIGLASIELENGQYVVKYEYLGNEMSKKGFVDTSLTLYSEGSQITVQPFKISIVADIRDAVGSSEEYGIMQELLADIREAHELTREAVENTQYAKTQGDYAKAQGNYAKSQGDSIIEAKRLSEEERLATEQVRIATESARVESVAVKDATEQVRLDTLSVKTETEIATQAAKDITAVAETKILEWKYANNHDMLKKYKVNNVVTFNGSSYIAIKDNIGIVPVGDVNDINWRLVAKKGEDGEGLVVLHKDTFISTEGQTVFTLSNQYDQLQNRIHLVVGGSLQYSPENFMETSANSVTLNTPLPAGIDVTAIYFGNAPAIKNDLQLQINTINDIIQFAKIEALREAANYAIAQGDIAKANADIVIANEDLRKTSETTRESNESSRKLAESERVLEEGVRKTAEGLRSVAENERASSETTRVLAETTRQSSETSREASEVTRKQNEDARVLAETTRQAQEATRQSESSLAVTNVNKVADDTLAVKNATELVRVATEEERLATKLVKEQTDAVRIAFQDERLATENVRAATDAVRLDTIKVKDDTILAKNEAIQTSINTQAVADSFAYANLFDPAVQYKKNNIVTYNGSSYIAIQDSIGVIPEGSVNDLTWRIVARKGQDGGGVVVLYKDVFTATENQRVFTLSREYDRLQNWLRVIVGGVEQFTPEDFMETSPTTFTLNFGVPANTQVVAIYFANAPVVASDIQVQVNNMNDLVQAVNSQLSNKVDKVVGKQLSTEDFTSVEKTKLLGIEEGANKYEHPLTHPADMIVQDINNRMVTDIQITSWDAKETVTGSQAKSDKALTDAKVYTDNKVANLVGTAPETLDTLHELASALGNDPNFATTVANQIGNKVDKVTGKQLSTEDFTTEEKAKLLGIESGANKYTHPTFHPPSIISQDATSRFVTDTQIADWNAKETTTGSQTKATQAETNAKTYADTELAKKVDKITGKGLSTEDYSTSEKTKLAGIEANANKYVRPIPKVETFIATAGKTLYTLTGSYVPNEGRIQLIVGGVPQFSPSNFTETSSTSFTLSEATSAGVEIVAMYF